MLLFLLIGMAAGETYPAMPFFVVTPCPLLIFTFGRPDVLPTGDFANYIDGGFGIRLRGGGAGGNGGTITLGGMFTFPDRAPFTIESGLAARICASSAA